MNEGSDLDLDLDLLNWLRRSLLKTSGYTRISMKRNKSIDLKCRSIVRFYVSNDENGKCLEPFLHFLNKPAETFVTIVD